MMIDEFNSRVSKPVTEVDYDKIELVYAYHPSISETKGKDQIAMLYETFGMRIILDMLPTATKAAEYEERIAQLKMQLKSVEHEYNDFAKKR